MKTAKSLKIVAVLAGLLAFSGLAYAEECDLSTALSSCGPINGALFQQVDPQSTGTGVFPSFVQIGNNEETERGYNTTAWPVFDNQNADPHNHELLLADVPIVNIEGTNYYEFVLDINQIGSGSGNLITLDEIQIYQSNTPNQSTTTLGDLGTLVYQLDAGGNSVILVNNFITGNGSGDGDMNMYIPASLFNTSIDYVYLYSEFGGDTFGGERYVNNDGFEEWAHREAQTPVPEPATLILLGTGLLGVAGKVRRRTKKS